jgi:hypothetical protein
VTLTKFSIDRAWWGTGALLCDDGKMCCLGHLAVACGYSKASLRKGDLDSGIPLHTWRKVPGPFRSLDSTVAAKVASINDAPYKSHIKEKKLKELFKENGIRLTFRGCKKKGKKK